jgi:ectoine hydroxylase
MQDLYPSRGSGRAGFLPRRDPVLYSRWTPSAPLTEEQALQFETQGFLVLDGLFSAGEVARFQAETRGLIAGPDHLDPATIITEQGTEAVRSIFRIHGQSALFGDLVADQRLADVARFILGDEVYIHQSRLNHKPGFTGKDFFWHSDFETWHVEDGMPRMRAISMSLLLAPNSHHNGSVMFMPGSHRTFLACAGETPDDHYLTSLKKQEIGVPSEKYLAEMAQRYGITVSIGEPGSVLVFDSNILHGSNSNISPMPRSNAFFVYNAMQNRLVAPYGRTTARPTFIAEREARPLARPYAQKLENTG